MPKHFPNLTKRLNHVPLLKPQNSPYPVPHIDYGKKIQTSLIGDENSLLPAQGVKFTQSMTGAELHLARISYYALVVTYNELSTQ